MQKEDIFTIVFFAAIGLAVPAVAVLRHFIGIDILPFVKPNAVRTVLGLFFATAAILVCALNVYLSFVSPWLHRRRYGSLEAYHGPSGLPVIGGFFILGAGALLPESVTTGIFLLALYALDTGGVPWFFLLLLRDVVERKY